MLQATITADAIIDNRKELGDALGVSRHLPDGRLILQAYRRWGNDCPKRLVGDFAFAIWDEAKRKLFCAVDHTWRRSPE